MRQKSNITETIKQYIYNTLTSCVASLLPDLLFLLDEDVLPRDLAAIFMIHTHYN